ncbi:MAG: hypothetical protein QM728_12300 [Gordonia sp. (in: high G+C Gram-positive bacteria)]|uniref:hypothetical protein n=1 Tax=Gordonia sp. (in: high G+C Gram-positive bacteria) TaxID=84139 RepID=UPI0039E6E73A
MTATAQRITQITLLVLGVLLSLMAVFLFLGCVKGDRQIDKNKATAVAEVSSADRLRASAGFFTPDGKFHNPQVGLLYPTRLSVGQRIAVDYDAANPDGLVRPTGRNWTLAIVPCLSVIVGSWLIIGLAMVAVAETGKRRREQTPEPAGQPA